MHGYFLLITLEVLAYSVFHTFFQGPWKMTAVRAFNERYSRSFSGHCQRPSNHNTALARGGLRVKRGGRCIELSNGRREKVCMCMCVYASKSSSLSTGHRYKTQILNQLCSCEIHVNWNALIANQFTKAYFKAWFLWYTLLRVNTLKLHARALIERHYTGSVKTKIWVQYKVSSSKQHLWHNADYHNM